MIAGLAPTLASPGARATSAQNKPPAVSPSPAAPDRSLSFEANAGQFDPKVRFVSRGPAYTLFLTPDEAVFDLVSHSKAPAGPTPLDEPPAEEVRSGAVVRMRLVGANPQPVVEGQEELAAMTNYFIGNDPAKWQRQVPSYARVVYRDIYPGIDMVWREGDGSLEYDFVVAPGADPSAVAVTYEGADSVSIVDGDLVIRTAAGDLRQHRPVTYQDASNGTRLPVDSRFVDNGTGGIGFEVGAYDGARPLVIDPEVIYSTRLGGRDSEIGRAVAADRFGNAYVTGQATRPSFPVTSGAYQRGAEDGKSNAFITKLNPAGSRDSGLVYSAYIGSSAGDTRALDIAVDSATGMAYIVALSEGGDFPTRNGVRASGSGYVVAVFNAAGSDLVYGTYLWSGDTYGRGSIAVDRHGSAYVTGGMAGSAGDANLPAAPGFRSPNTGSGDVYVAKLDPNKAGGASLVYLTRIGGSRDDRGDSVVVDDAGNAYISGYTVSGIAKDEYPYTGNTASNDFPVTHGHSGADRTGVVGGGARGYGGRGGSDVFVAKLDPIGTTLAFSTIIGGRGDDAPSYQGFTAVTVDRIGVIYVTGQTPVWPVTEDAYQKNYGGGSTDQFLAIFDPRLGDDAYVYGTYLGGSSAEGIGVGQSKGIEVDDNGEIYIATWTGSANFPVTDTSKHRGGTYDLVFLTLNTTKPPQSALVRSTYIGGTDSDYGADTARDGAGNFYLTGTSQSHDFPTHSAYQSTENPAARVFVMKIGDPNRLGDAAPASGSPQASSLDPATGPSVGGTRVNIRGTNLNASEIEVYFGQSRAEAVTLVDGALVAVTPAHDEGTVPVVVKTEFGQSQPTPAMAFTYVKSAGPTVASVTPAVSAIGDSVTVRGTGLDRTSVVRFGDVRATETTSLNDELVATVPAQPAASVVDVTVATSSGTSTATAASRFSYATGRWAPASPLSDCTPRSVSCTRRSSHTATTLTDGRILLIGGTYVSTYGMLSNAQIYEPSTASWHPIAPMRRTRKEHTATLLEDGRVLVAGGQGWCADSPVPASGDPNPLCGTLTAEIYNPVNGSWSDAGRMDPSLLSPIRNDATQRFGHTATLLAGSGSQCGSDCGKVLVVGGSKGEATRHESVATAELFDSATGVFTPVAPMSEPRVSHTATLLPDGKVLVSGGMKSRGDLPLGISDGTLQAGLALSSAELYDPLTRSWSPTGAMAEQRLSHTATLLSTQPCGTRCGKVLVTGGLIASGKLSAGSEFYDPASGKWSPGDVMNQARAGHTATALPDGTVLAAGSGRPFQGQRVETTRSAEVFEPVAGKWRLTSAMVEPKGMHTASVLGGAPCRQIPSPSYCEAVLVTGGVSTGGGHEYARESTEIYRSVPVLAGVVSAGTGLASRPVAGGTKLTLTGAHFNNVSEVSLETVATRAGVSVPFSLDSPTSISLTTPAHEKGPVNVLVTNDVGISARSARFVYVGLPGKVAELRPIRASDTRVDISFDAPDDGTTLSKATQYLIKQSTSPIIDEASFGAARSLCPEGTCTFKLADEIMLSVNDLEPSTQYFYAVKALNALGEAGEMTAASAVTLPPADTGATSCPALSEAVVGQIPLAGGRYSLVGFPEGTVMGAGALLYGWFDRGAGGTYGLHGAEEPLRPGRGYWAWSACPRLVEIDAGAPSASFPLGAYHASIVGNPSGASPATVSGHDFAARWDPDANGGAGAYRLSGYREQQSLSVGEGTWVFTFTDTFVRIATGL